MSQGFQGCTPRLYGIGFRVVYSTTLGLEKEDLGNERLGP